MEPADWSAQRSRKSALQPGEAARICAGYLRSCCGRLGLQTRSGVLNQPDSAQSGDQAKGLFAGISLDGESRTRTGDTTIFSRVLYQLSYLAAPPIVSAEGRGLR